MAPEGASRMWEYHKSGSVRGWYLSRMLNTRRDRHVYSTKFARQARTAANLEIGLTVGRYGGTGRAGGRAELAFDTSRRDASPGELGKDGEPPGAWTRNAGWCEGMGANCPLLLDRASEAMDGERRHPLRGCYRRRGCGHPRKHRCRKRTHFQDMIQLRRREDLADDFRSGKIKCTIGIG